MVDLISRQAAIDALTELRDKTVASESFRIGLYRAIEELKDLPSAQPEQKKGIWLSKNLPICIGAKELVEVYICSNCGHVVDGNDLSNFCSVCGCDMRGESDG